MKLICSVSSVIIFSCKKNTISDKNTISCEAKKSIDYYPRERANKKNKDSIRCTYGQFGMMNSPIKHVFGR